MRKRYVSLLVIIVLVLVVSISCTAKASSNDTAAAMPTQSVPAATIADLPSDSSGVVAAFEGTLEQIYEQVNPSVVNISVVQKQEVTLPTFPDIQGFFDFPFSQNPQLPSQPQEYYSHALGSGFVWDADGHIVTNNHVVDGADKVTVTFSDGTSVSADIVGTDPASDLAVIHVDVDSSQLHPVQVGDSTQVKVGQLAIAIGNPFGLQGTMTEGIVSAVGRSLPVEGDDVAGIPGYTISDIIQTDAPINPGNSGGVLLDANGQLIGVTAAIESSTQSSAGIGFAIPSAIVRQVVPALIGKGSYDHPWLGISGMDLTPDIASAMDLKSDQRGALVVAVIADSPADKAGLRGSDKQVTIDGIQLSIGGDVIVAIEGQSVQDMDDLVTYLARSTQVGQQITLRILRDGKQKEISVTLTARPTTGARISTSGDSSEGAAWMGILGTDVTPQIAEAMNLPSDQAGALVVQVVVDSPADDAGLRGSYKPVSIEGQTVLVGGDIITALDGDTVESMADLQSMIQDHAPNDRVTLSILRDGQAISIDVVLAEQ